MLTLYQAEWCPYSSAVREILNELGLEFLVKPVEAWPDDRRELQAVSGGNSIPTLRLDNGDVVIGTRDIFRHLETITPWKWADEPSRLRRQPSAPALARRRLRFPAYERRDT